MPGTNGKVINKDTLFTEMNNLGEAEASLSLDRLRRVMRSRKSTALDVEGVVLQHGDDFAMQFLEADDTRSAAYGRVERIIKIADPKRKPIVGPVLLDQTEHKYAIIARWYDEDDESNLSLRPLAHDTTAFPMDAVLMPVALYYESDNGKFFVEAAPF